MGAQFGRLKTWVKERLKFSDLNSEFDNVLTNFTPSGLDGASATTTDMRATTDPAPYVSGAQSESLATNTLGELQRLRFMFARFFGGTYWYSDPGRILTALHDDFVASLPFEGASTAEVFADAISRGSLINALTLTTASFATGNIDTTHTKFSNPSYALGAGVALALPAKSSAIGSLSCHFRNLSAGDYVAYNPLLGIELYLDGSGFLVAKVTKRTTTSEVAKATSSVTGAVSRAGNTNFAHVALKWRLANYSGSGSDLFGLFYGGLAEGSQLSATNLLINAGLGGNWYLGAKRNDPTWDHYSSMKVLPQDEAVDAWGVGGDATQGTISADGILTVATVGGAATAYSKTNNINLAQMNVEVKARLTVTEGDSSGMELITIADTSLSRKIILSLYPGELRVSLGGNANKFRFSLPTHEWHVFRITSSGSPDPTVKIWIDGQCVLNYVMADSIVVGASFIQFSATPPDSANDMTAEWEYVAYESSGGAVKPPVVGSAAGQLADIAFLKTALSASVIAQLVNNAAKVVYGRGPSLGLSLPAERYFSGSVVTSSSAHLNELPYTYLYFASDGKTPVSFEATGRGTNSSAAHLLTVGLTLDDVFQLAARDNITTASQLAIIGRRVFAAGLHKINVGALEAAATGDTVGFSGNFLVRG